MNFNEFMESYANEIGGQFQEYDTNKSVVFIHWAATDIRQY